MYASMKYTELFLLLLYRPDLVNMKVVASHTPQENLEMAFTIAENQLGVTRLLDPEGTIDLILC